MGRWKKSFWVEDASLEQSLRILIPDLALVFEQQY